jgi:sterol desaturase/sphingolipid hydroxylase (fatty acid hydroxylase superfamily)
MALVNTTSKRVTRDIVISLFIYALPIAVLIYWFHHTGETPWINNAHTAFEVKTPHALDFLQPVFKNIQSWGFFALILLLGATEFGLGLYDNKWTKKERIIDIVCFVAPKVLLAPVVAFFALHLLPGIIPHLKNEFSWVPFWGAVFLIAIADDLTQYWYHRLHHQLPLLWRFHRTHHSAPYMGMAMANRQNFIYTILFSQIYLLAVLTYLGLGPAALFVGVLKGIIGLAAHSSIPWDKPFYKYKALHPIAWVFERVISTPATHHAHHADSSDDGVGYYKGNFGNMFFLWDVIFGTGIITRKYPKGYGIAFYKEEEWYAQFLWPIFKSKIEGSELSKNGPRVGDEEEELQKVGLGSKSQQELATA